MDLEKFGVIDFALHRDALNAFAGASVLGRDTAWAYFTRCSTPDNLNAARVQDWPKCCNTSAMAVLLNLYSEHTRSARHRYAGVTFQSVTMQPSKRCPGEG